MSTTKKVSSVFKPNADTGFGVSPDAQGGRFINKDGTFNVVKTGIPLHERFSPYYKLLMMPAWEFTLVLLSFFFVVNVLFTVFYLLMNPGEFTGVIADSNTDRAFELFFFSAQTFTTVGYGRINPIGHLAGFIASVEALAGLSSFALITGVLYGRFSRPRAYLKFSERALVAPYQDKTALMFRFVSYKENHTLTDVEVKVTLGLTEHDGKAVFKFFQLPLERSRVDSLSMNWTVVHPIDEESPLFGFNSDDLKLSDAEVYVLVRGFDDVLSNTVLQRTSYRFNEIVFNAKFERMYHESEDDTTTIVEIDKLNDFKMLS